MKQPLLSCSSRSEIQRGHVQPSASPFHECMAGEIKSWDQAARDSWVAEDETLDSGARRLKQLGYKQELRRSLGFFSMFAIAFSNVTLFTGIVPYYGLALSYVGPGIAIWGWVIVLFFVTFIALSLAEICSAYPTAGSLYFWAASLAAPRYSPIASWITAWLETTGQVAGTATMTFACAQMLQALILLSTGTYIDGGYFAPAGVLIAFFIGFNFIFAVLNSFAVDVVAWVSVASVWWQVFGSIVLFIALPVVAPTHQPASVVFTSFNADPVSVGLPTVTYCYIVGLLMSQYSLYGYDTAGHVTEETKEADRAGPKAILMSVAVIGVLGLVFLLVLTFSIQGDYTAVLDPSNETGGTYTFAVYQIMWSIFEARYNSGTGALVLIYLFIFPSFFVGALVVMTTAVRVIYAVARDNSLPFSNLLRHVDDKTKVPIITVWVNFVLSTLIVIPVIKNQTVFFAISSIFAIGQLGSYSVPIFFRMLLPDEQFPRGPFHLGRFGRPVAFVGWLWALYTCAAFLLPQTYPITWTNFNYAPVAFGVVILFAGIWWIVSARKWYKGPVKEI